ncbi:hypothetical protein FSP39_018192 [Pinctada imbricata]|uniref:Uncharacterized protein n=1 Tax=Pinctada imbricata TaxID=66713 RepID=A0AA88YIS0_PINIB|nr:hypothetical protein FSP39_018192 [Pinctada imbricata]
MANFEIGSIDEILNLQPMETVDFDENQDKEWDLLSKILNDDMVMEVTDVSCSTVNDEALREMDKALEAANPVTSPVPYHDDKQKRFESISEEELNELQDNKQSKSTKKNTKWAISVFQEDRLAELLRRFYAEATPRISDKRIEDLNENLAAEYHKNTLKSMRSGINRHLRDLDRDVDIVCGRTFRHANDVLEGKLKQNLRYGVSRPTKHKDVIHTSDLQTISLYLGNDNLVKLRYKVWYDLGLHFVTRGLEFHEQLNTSSFDFHVDENGREYAVLNHETKEKTRQGGLDAREDFADKRMYATNTEKCPLASLKLLLSKTSSEAVSLFNHCSKDALKNPSF